ncbi:ABC transporter ATP-binding protein [Actinophytocola algeriensis]|jgi:ABC-2 type transport system ATP-binding protein|uniref:ABC-2 type transport system ATP-binding protein n=1 Tax=Actinophytocola algeriensis TaxID=1768010 RepID=A0A7W7Q9U8_9PSEU|nr:ABC transporter ATP-binding protein [Actinophytocola algeriensis]MBB4909266.1 ABC-2 type transport system ATP-binding protein [Actinophytocola algeriensis]MBE1474346.1 ABC-2 type transport system ATP-binding protein [Actinophytocola algeriensis]
MTAGTTALAATGLGKKYRRTWALKDCSLSVPEGRVVALVGPNGAGKTTLLHLVVGLLAPDQGDVTVLGSSAGTTRTLSRVAFLAQDKPLYDGFSVADMLRFGARTNPGWDQDMAVRRLASLDIPLDRRVGKLSGGQQAQVALTVALAKRPELLVLDEPLANLDPLARHEVMRGLMAAVAESGMTVVLSSHVVSDLVDTCDWLVVLNGGRVQVSGDIEDLLAGHRLLTGPAELADGVAGRLAVVDDDRTDRQATLLVRTGEGRPPLDPRWTDRGVNLEELVLAYLRRPDSAALPKPALARA